MTDNEKKRILEAINEAFLSVTVDEPGRSQDILLMLCDYDKLREYAIQNFLQLYKYMKNRDVANAIRVFHATLVTTMGMAFIAGETLQQSPVPEEMPSTKKADSLNDEIAELERLYKLESPPPPDQN